MEEVKPRRSRRSVYISFLIVATLYRFPEEVFNGVELDCFNKDDNCARRAVKVLGRYTDFIYNFVKAIFDNVESPEHSWTHLKKEFNFQSSMCPFGLVEVMDATIRQLDSRYVLLYVCSRFDAT